MKLTFTRRLRLMAKISKEQFIGFTVVVWKGERALFSLGGWTYGPKGLFPPQPFSYGGGKLRMVEAEVAFMEEVRAIIEADKWCMEWIAGNKSDEETTSMREDVYE